MLLVYGYGVMKIIIIIINYFVFCKLVFVFKFNMRCKLLKDFIDFLILVLIIVLGFLVK